MDEALKKLLENPRVWRGGASASSVPGLASGYAQLDRHLPGGGWPANALTEILLAEAGSGELKLLMPALARLSHAEPESFKSGAHESGWLAWIAPPFDPYPPALLEWGSQSHTGFDRASQKRDRNLVGRRAGAGLR